MRDHGFLNPNGFNSPSCRERSCPSPETGIASSLMDLYRLATNGAGEYWDSEVGTHSQ